MHHQTGSIKILQQRNEKTADEEKGRKGTERAEIKKSSQIYHLNPYIDEDGIIRVGGRLDISNVNNECKHPILLPKSSPISKLIIAWCL